MGDIEIPRKVLIHCDAGDGRTGTLVASVFLQELSMEQLKASAPVEYTVFFITNEEGTMVVSQPVYYVVLQARFYYSREAVETKEQIEALESLCAKLIEETECPKFKG